MSETEDQDSGSKERVGDSQERGIYEGVQWGCHACGRAQRTQGKSFALDRTHEKFRNSPHLGKKLTIMPLNCTIQPYLHLLASAKTVVVIICLIHWRSLLKAQKNSLDIFWYTRKTEHPLLCFDANSLKLSDMWEFGRKLRFRPSVKLGRRLAIFRICLQLKLKESKSNYDSSFLRKTSQQHVMILKIDSSIRT